MNIEIHGEICALQYFTRKRWHQSLVTSAGVELRWRLQGVVHLECRSSCLPSSSIFIIFILAIFFMLMWIWHLFLHCSHTCFLVVQLKQMLFIWEVCYNKYHFIFKSRHRNYLCYCCCCCCVVALVWAWLFVELVRNCCVTAKSLHLISSSPTQCRRCHWGAGWMIMNGYHRF